MSTNDIVINITSDTSDLTRGMTETRDQLNQTITTINKQDVTWKHMAITAVESVARIAGPVISLISAKKQLATATSAVGAANAAATAPTFSFAAAVNFLLAPITLVAAAIVIAAAAIWYFSSASDSATVSAKSFGKATEEVAYQASAIENIKEAFAVALFGPEWIDNIAELKKSINELGVAFASLGNEIEKPFVSAGFESGQLANVIFGLDVKIKLLTGSIDAVTHGVELFTNQVKSGIQSVELFAYQLATGADEKTARGFLAQRDAIQQMAIEADRFRKANDFAVKESAELMRIATKTAEDRGEVSRIASITNIDLLNKETESLQEFIQNLKLRKKYGEEEKKIAFERADAIAKQREGIESGRIKEKESPAAEQIAAAERALLALRDGRDAAAIAAIRSKNATDQEVESLKSLLGAMNKIIEERKVEAEFAKRMDKIVAEVESKQASGKNKIQDLRDEIDILTGAATKAEVAIGKMLRDGFSQDQAEEISRLTEELDQLKDTKKDVSSDKGLKASLKGTQEAASIMLRGINGLSKDEIAKDQLAIQKQLLAATKENKPQKLQAAIIGA